MSIKNIYTFCKKNYWNSNLMRVASITAVALFLNSVFYLALDEYYSFWGPLRNYANAIMFVGFLVLPGVMYEYAVKGPQNDKETVSFDKVGYDSWLTLLIGSAFSLISVFPYYSKNYLVFGILFFVGSGLIFYSYLKFVFDNLTKIKKIKTALSEKTFLFFYSAFSFYLTVQLFGEVNKIFLVNQSVLTFTLIYGVAMKLILSAFLTYMIAVIMTTAYFKNEQPDVANVESKRNIGFFRRFLFLLWGAICKFFNLVLNFMKLKFVSWVINIFSSSDKKFWICHYLIMTSLFLILVIQVFSEKGKLNFLANVAYEIDFNENFYCSSYLSADDNLLKDKLFNSTQGKEGAKVEFKGIPLTPDQSIVFLVTKDEIDNYDGENAIGVPVKCYDFSFK